MFKRLTCLFFCFFVFLNANAFSTNARYAFLMDTNTGAVLYEKNAYQKMTPSSMSKLMTLYLTFERLKNGDIKLEDNIPVTTKAWKMGGTRMFLLPNTSVSVEDLLRGVIVQSGNDASVALAEGLAGNEEDFVRRMNAKASDLGLQNTHFMNATGLPHINHYMSASDIAYLSASIMRDFPGYYHYFSEKQFSFNKITQANRNTLLHSNGVDGLKTGHTEAGKYGVVVSAFQNGRRLVAVVNGTKNERERAAEARKLLQYGFLNFTNVTVAKAGQKIDVAKVFLGVAKKVDLVAKKDIVFTVPIAQRGKTNVKVTYTSTLHAPVDRSTKLGEVNIELNGKTHSFALYPAKNIKKAGVIKRVFIKAITWFSSFKFSDPEIKKNTRNFMA